MPRRKITSTGSIPKVTEAPDEDVVVIYNWMKENNVTQIDFEYSGSGDDGDFSISAEGKGNDDVSDAVQQLLQKRVHLSFNDTGCNGSGHILRGETSIKLVVEHNDVTMSSEDHSFTHVFNDERGKAVYDYMKENKISKIELAYSGSGDSGGVDQITGYVGKKEVEVRGEIANNLEDMVYSLSEPNFNNDGSSGDAVIHLGRKEGTVEITVEHSDNYEEENTTTVDDELLDENYIL